MNHYLDSEPVIGLEIHAQLLTRSKMFCGCSATYAGSPPNSHVCAVCAGMPGALPVINRRAVEWTILVALALECSIAEWSKFDRKNYSYPDLPKGYQISQYDRPLGVHGRLRFDVDGRTQSCGIVRVHLEEDTGKLTHTSEFGRDVSLVDYNRSGVPLIEIVGEPGLDSALAAREYFSEMRRTLIYLGVNDGNLQEGSMRADVNVSLRAADGALGTKVEIKNLNSFRAVQRALEYEIERQRSVLAGGGTIEQETRGWVETDEITVSQRTKEHAHDYRYFPEPDLPPVVTQKDQIEEIRSSVPELPGARERRFVDSLGLRPEIAAILTDEKELADYFEAALASASRSQPARVANWVSGDVVRLHRETGVRLGDGPLSAASVGLTVDLVETGAISGAAGKTVLEAMAATGESPNAVVERLNLRQIEDRSALENVVTEVLAANPKLVQSFERNPRVIEALVGKTMAASGGRASPALVRLVLQEQLRG